MDLCLTTVIAFILVVIFVLYMYASQRKRPIGRYPFWPISEEEAGPKTAERYVYERKARKKLLRPQFSAAAVGTEPYDAIVIGSGMGGMASAVLMSRAGQRVLVLEQNAQVGGCCHTFNHKGYEFDVGVHYIGQMDPRRISGFIMHQITGGRLEWAQLDPDYDVIVIGEGAEAEHIAVGPRLEDSKESLIRHFPEEKEAITKFFALVRSSRSSWTHLMIMKMLPHWLARFLVWCGALDHFSSFCRANKKTLAQLLDELTQTPALRTALSYNFGDYGTVPATSGWLMQTGLWDHFSRGGFYPVGGASEMTMTMMTELQKAGGKLLGKANVCEIICDPAGRACGVRVKAKAKKGEEEPTEVEVRAPLIISSAGVLNTVRMLPQRVLEKSRLPQITQKVGPGVGAVSVFIGMRNSNETLKLPVKNFWIFPFGRTLDNDAAIAKLLSHNSLEAFLDSNEPVIVFASFPSAKDPLWTRRCEDEHRSSCTLITFAPYEWFEAWKDRKVKKRGEQYEDLKRRLAMRMWYQLCSVMPPEFEAQADMELLDIGTPLSNNHYIGATHGEIYGLDHSAARFRADLTTNLRPDVGVPGLLLAGQDLATCGIVGGMIGGVMAASEALNRNLLLDIPRLAQQYGSRESGAKGKIE